MDFYSSVVTVVLSLMKRMVDVSIIRFIKYLIFLIHFGKVLLYFFKNISFIFTACKKKKKKIMVLKLTSPRHRNLLHTTKL